MQNPSFSCHLEALFPLRFGWQLLFAFQEFFSTACFFCKGQFIMISGPLQDSENCFAPYRAIIAFLPHRQSAFFPPRGRSPCQSFPRLLYLPESFNRMAFAGRLSFVFPKQKAFPNALQGWIPPPLMLGCNFFHDDSPCPLTASD